MTTDQNLTLAATLSGYRLIVLANRFGCDTDLSRELHDRLVEGLEPATARVRTIIALERNVLTGEDEFAECQLEGEVEIFGRFAINLLDDLEIDFDTHEYRINGGGWINALTAVNDVEYPELVALTEEELGSLAPIIKDITREAGIAVHAARDIDARCAGS